MYECTNRAAVAPILHNRDAPTRSLVRTLMSTPNAVTAAPAVGAEEQGVGDPPATIPVASQPLRPPADARV